MALKPSPAVLRRRLERVRVHSCADGSFGIEPVWREPYVTRPQGMLRELPPGLLTRMSTAEEIELALNALLRVGKNEGQVK